jgi:hypothetical protein
MIVEHDVDAIGICQVQQSVQTLQKVGVEGILIPRLGTSPHHPEPDEVPTERLYVVHIRLVEGGA